VAVQPQYGNWGHFDVDSEAFEALTDMVTRRDGLISKSGGEAFSESLGRSADQARASYSVSRLTRLLQCTG
jgi:hypothetical protein